MTLAKRHHDALIRCCSLQFEIEGRAESLSQRKSPGLVDPSPERSMQNELHTAALIEEALRDYGCLSGDGAEDRAALRDICNRLFGAPPIQPAVVLEPQHGIFRRELADPFPDHADVGRQFESSRRRFSAPERNRWRRAMRVFHADPAGLDAANLPGGVSEQHDVAGQTLDGESASPVDPHLSSEKAPFEGVYALDVDASFEPDDEEHRLARARPGRDRASEDGLHMIVGVVGFRVGEDEIGITALREAAGRLLGDALVPWYFSYRMRVGVK